MLSEQITITSSSPHSSPEAPFTAPIDGNHSPSTVVVGDPALYYSPSRVIYGRTYRRTTSPDKWIIEEDRVIKSRNKFISAEAHHKFVTVEGQAALWFLFFSLLGAAANKRHPISSSGPGKWWWRMVVRPPAVEKQQREPPVSPICLHGSEPSFIFLATIHTDIYGHNKIYFKQRAKSPSDRGARGHTVREASFLSEGIISTVSPVTTRQGINRIAGI